MFVNLMMRRRISLNETVIDLNKSLSEKLSGLPSFWGKNVSLGDPPFSFNGESGLLDLRKALQVGFSGQVSYAARFPDHAPADIAMNDDFLQLRIETGKVNYNAFCVNLLPSLIKAFNPYRTVIETDNNIALNDFDITRQKSKETGRNINGRDSIYRIWPVCFFDDLLCHRAFGIGATEVVTRATSVCESAEQLNDGAFLIVTSEIVVGSALDVLNTRLLKHLDNRLAA